VTIGTIRLLTDKAEIQAFLDQDRIYHAYALADLSDPFFEQCHWWGVEAGGNLTTVILLFAGLTPPALLLLGQAEILPEVLAEIDLPERILFMSKQAQYDQVLAFYRPEERIEEMMRMALDPAHFRPVENKAAVRLDERHLMALQDLYRPYGANAFAPYQLRQGVFYGVFAEKRLVAAAGTHIIAPEYGVAAVGNIFTDPAYRGYGYAQQATSAVCLDLLERDCLLVLNVDQANQSAVHVYHKLGFQPHCTYREGAMARLNH
jgi:ribosomal protein S18 acetylase RimI-like enzyme